MKQYYGIKNNKVIKLYPHKIEKKTGRHNYYILWKTTKENLPSKTFHGKFYKSREKANKNMKKQKGGKFKSLRKSKILSKKNYEKYIKNRKSNKKLTKKQNKDLDNTLFIKYCKCIKDLKYNKKVDKGSEYPICTSSIYNKRGFTPPKNIKMKCKKYR